MNFSKNSRSPTIFKCNKEEGMKLRSGRFINNFTTSSEIAIDIRALSHLFVACSCLNSNHDNYIGKHFHKNQYVVGGKKMALENFKKNHSFWQKNCGPGAVYIPKYMFEILSNEHCAKCLKCDLLFAFVSRHKEFLRNSQVEELQSGRFKNTAIQRLDEIINYIRVETAGEREPDFSCTKCRTLQDRARSMMYKGPVTRSQLKRGSIYSIEQDTLKRLTPRDNTSLLKKTEYLKKYITSPHREVQTTYFKLGSILPRECVKQVFAFL